MSVPVRGATLTLSAVADNTIYSDFPSNSNGAGVHIFAGRILNSNDKRRALVKFDISTLPPGSTVTAVSLRLTVNKENSGSIAMTVHRLNNSWGEAGSNATGEEGTGAAAATGDATWIRRTYNTVSWGTQGGDFVAAASDSTNVNAVGNYTWTGAGMIADVNTWAANPSTNHGWILKGDETVSGSAKRFASRTNATTASRPQLTITYTPPAASGACCFGDGNCTVTTPASCSSQFGTYQGNGTDCTPNPCPQPVGACCASNGTCTSITENSCLAANGTWKGASTSCSLEYCPVTLNPFVDPLPIPTVITPTSVGSNGIPNYDVYIREFNHSFHSSLPTNRVWGYNSMYPGPTFEVRKGDPVRVTWHNDLRGTNGQLRATHLMPYISCYHGPDVTGRTPVTVTHLHGLKVAPESDGAPDDSFAPGFSSSQYFYPNDQQAATLWYHDHALGITRINVYSGLAGFYFIRDDAEDALNIPRGEYEVPIVIQDRNLQANGSIRYNPDETDAFFGDKIVVNGKVWPYLNVKRGKYRFRIVNGSNTRTYTLEARTPAGGPVPFSMIASDGGLLAAPVPLTSLTLMPGERGDIVLDFQPFASTSNVVLVNTAPAPFPGGTATTMNVMQFRMSPPFGDTDPLPASLIPVPEIPENSSDGSKSFTLRQADVPECTDSMWLINDLLWDDITDFVRIGDTEVWSFVNRSAIAHPMHVHLVQFQVLDRQAFQVVNNVVTPTGPLLQPPPEEQGWKDTVQCPPLQITRVIATFEGYYGRFPTHCHILEHEDHEMMRQFEVTCDPPVVVNQSGGGTVVEGTNPVFTVNVTGDIPEFRWRKGIVNLVDGPTGTGSVISGALTPTLTITNAQASDSGSYRCLITNPCGHPSSNAVTLTVVPSCSADINNDGFVNTQDLTLLLAQFGQNVVPGSGADINADGTVNTTDLTLLLAQFGQAC